MRYKQLYLEKTELFPKANAEIATTFRVIDWLIWSILANLIKVKWWGIYYNILQKLWFEDGPLFVCEGHISCFERLNSQNIDFKVVLRRALVLALTNWVDPFLDRNVFDIWCSHLIHEHTKLRTATYKAEILRELRAQDAEKKRIACPVLYGDMLLNELLNQGEWVIFVK